MRLLIFAVMTAAAGAASGKKGGGGGVASSKRRSGPSELHLEWFAPFMSGGGYSSEAIAFATALEPRIKRFQIAQHGEEADENFGLGIPAKARKLATRTLLFVVYCKIIYILQVFINTSLSLSRVLFIFPVVFFFAQNNNRS